MAVPRNVVLGCTRYVPGMWGCDTSPFGTLKPGSLHIHDAHPAPHTTLSFFWAPIPPVASSATNPLTTNVRPRNLLVDSAPICLFTSFSPRSPLWFVDFLEISPSVWVTSIARSHLGPSIDARISWRYPSMFENSGDQLLSVSSQEA